MGLFLREIAGYAAVACLMTYQVPQVARIIRRKSAEDFSIVAYCFVVAGLALYCVATWHSPAFWPSVMSLANASTMLGVVLYYRKLRGRLGEVFRRKPRRKEPEPPLEQVDPFCAVQPAKAQQGCGCRHRKVERERLPAADR